MPSHGREAKALASWRVEAGAADMREACVEPDSDRQIGLEDICLQLRWPKLTVSKSI